MRLLGRALSRVSIAGMDDARIARLQAQRPPAHDRCSTRSSAPPGVTVEDGAAATSTGPLRLRTYRPAGSAGTAAPLVAHLHGGGWVLGSLEGSDWLCSQVAAAVGAVVVSVDYRLAPVHRWPAAAEDCYAGLVDVVARAAELGVDPARVAVMGDSAGGNLAAVVALMARDRSGPAIAFQGLLYPGTDLTLASPSIDENAHAPILTKADCVAFRDHYLGGQDPREPYASPLHAADLSGLPPGLVQVAARLPQLPEAVPQRTPGARRAVRRAAERVRTSGRRPRRRAPAAGRGAGPVLGTG